MTHLRLLTRFIHLDEVPSELGSVMDKLDMRIQCREPIATLTLQDVKNVLDQFLCDRLSDTELVYWADYLEMHPCVNYESGHEQEIASALFRLSTPEINGMITKVVAKLLKECL